MATYHIRTNGDKSKSILTIVHVKPFGPTSKSFRYSQRKAPKRTYDEAKKAAEAWAEPLEKQLKAQRERGNVSPDLASMTISGLIEEYLNDPKIKAIKSYEDYRGKLNWWLPNYGALKTLDFGVRTLRAARTKLQTTGRRRKTRAGGTVNRHLSVMRRVWNWGRESSGLVPMERVWPTDLLLQEPRGRTRFLSDNELARLLKAVEGDPVMRAAVLVSVATGIRQGELLRLKWADIDLDGNKLALHITKTGIPRIVYLAPAAVQALQALRETKVVSPTVVFLASEGEPLNPMSLRARWEKIRAAAKLVDFRWHDLRHSCASFLAREGATLLQIGSVLGHQNQSTTLRYAHLVQGEAVPGHAQLDKLLRGKS